MSEARRRDRRKSPTVHLLRAAATAALAAVLLGALGAEAVLRLRDRAGSWRALDPARDPVELTFTGAKTVVLARGGRADAPKPAGTFRAVCVGGSVAAGYPTPGRGFPERLAARLRAAYPDRAIEVWNLGRPGYGSARDAALLERVLADAAPDLVVVEEGNNETFEAQLSDALGRRPFARATAALRALAARTALGTRLLRAAPHPEPEPGDLERSLSVGPAAPGPLAVAGAQTIPSPERLAARLEGSLERIAAAARARGAAVLVVVPAGDERRALPVRVDWPEPGSPAALLAPAADLLRAARALDAGRAAGCERMLGRALDAPLRLFLLGRCEDALGRADAAAQSYAAWHDRQTTATRPLKDALRAAARARGLPLADLDAELRGGKLRAETLFADDHHMSAAGYAWAGDRIARAAADAGLLSRLGTPRPGALEAPLAAPAASAAEEAMTDVLLAHEFGAWAASTDDSIGGADGFARRSSELYASALRRDPAVFARASRPDAAPTSRGLLALAAWRVGREDDAARLLRAVAAEGGAPALWRALVDEQIRDPRFPLSPALGPAARALDGAVALNSGDWQLADRAAFYLPARGAPSRVVPSFPPRLTRAARGAVAVWWNGRRLRAVADGFTIPAEPGVLVFASRVSAVPLLNGTGAAPVPQSAIVSLPR